MPRNRSRFSRKNKWITLLGLALLAGGAAGVYLIESIGVPPRVLAPYIERRVSQHNPFIVKTGEWIAHSLTSLDRGRHLEDIRPSLRIGAQQGESPRPVIELTGNNVVRVDSTEAAMTAIAQARAGDVITFSPGTYRFRGQPVVVNRPGESGARITVRAAQAGTVNLELDNSEGFLVVAPYWTFENLVIRGVCKSHDSCEHAFHIAGDAHHFIARNNSIIDFNSHFKINGVDRKMPDDGIIENNTLTNASIRLTDNPVTPIDLVAANRWVIRRNLITDFIKGQSNRISFGAFAKGAGADNRFEQNIVICENLLKGAPGQRVGLSLGGGGTGRNFCRDQRCILEQERGVIESNLVASCSDDGIYVNRGAGSTIFHNTLIDTGGIAIRFPESSADIEGNLVDGHIRSRDEGIVRKLDNLETFMTNSYLGLHPIRALYVTGKRFEWSGETPRRELMSRPPLDLCRENRPSHPAYGAFENFSACLVQ
ncbi:right-handed parallel beta-helix repeat-containing protein [Noviherbaspirillum sp. ST9]|uniref:right-handed parallel beta-helix repeat-containing protein n=1 Tax=Noviherbaspirillum sp. ST9 TaxID=3401606 RepID=UPI003B587F5F